MATSGRRQNFTGPCAGGYIVYPLSTKIVSTAVQNQCEFMTASRVNSVVTYNSGINTFGIYRSRTPGPTSISDGWPADTMNVITTEGRTIGGFGGTDLVWGTQGFDRSDQLRLHGDRDGASTAIYINRIPSRGNRHEFDSAGAPASNIAAVQLNIVASTTGHAYDDPADDTDRNL
jgi:hypothetical protein